MKLKLNFSWRGVALGAFALVAILYAGTKPQSRMPRKMQQEPFVANGESIVANGENETILTSDNYNAGIVLARAETNEVWNFSPPDDAKICEDWLAFGANKDWFRLEFDEDFCFPFGTNILSALTIFSFGRIGFKRKNKSTFISPLETSLGIVPKNNWSRLSLENNPSQFWHYFTSSNSLVMTWQNVLLNRDANSPLSFQTELYENGNIDFRYDLSRLNENNLTNAILSVTNYSENVLYLYGSNTREKELTVATGAPRRCCDCPDHCNSNYVSAVKYSSNIKVTNEDNEEFHYSNQTCRVFISGVSPSRDRNGEYISFTTNGVVSDTMNFTVLGLKFETLYSDMPSIERYNEIPGYKVMLAHSLGNVLTSQAAVANNLSYHMYYMLNAAVPLEAYDEQSFASNMVDSAYENIDERLWASNWSSLFSSEDARSTIKWKGIFSSISNVVNCYSSTEDVLKNATPNGYGEAWAQQELFKGTSIWHGINPITFSNVSCEGGWGINTYFALDQRYYLPGVGLYPSKFTNYSNEDSIVHPLFTPFDDFSLHSTNLMTTIDVQMKYKLLADAIPATSYAAGANFIGRFKQKGNIDFESCKSGKWPRIKKPFFSSPKEVWYHSDIKNIAFFFIHQFYRRIVNESKKTD